MNAVKNILHKYHRVLFYSTWLIIHLIQAYGTELFDDEAYYWVYSKFPAWGYFDHPPVIALLIKGGFAVFHNELGVRLFSIILTTASIYLVETLIERENALLFYAICASMAIAQLGGMMAVPDTPLMFFVALFFCQYRRFTDHTTIWNTLLLGGCMALMLYTKYHAILIIVFTILSNIKLLGKYHIYIASLAGLVLFIPHIHWQYLNDFPSVQFHLFERNSAGYELKHTIEYIIGQVLLAGPITGLLLILAALKYNPVSISERALKYTFVGIYVFFLVSTLKGRAEANWTIPSFIGMMVLSHQYLLTSKKWTGILYKSVPITLLVVLASRIIMLTDLPPAWWIVKDEFHGNKIFAKSIRSKARRLPVVFIDSYQKPSKYWYYSGDTSMALNTPNYRRNNFNFWNIEDARIGKPAFVVGPLDKKHFPETFALLRHEKIGGRAVPKYYSFSRILFDNLRSEQPDSNTVIVRFTTRAPREYLHYFRESPYDSAQVYIAIYSKKKVVAYYPTGMIIKDINREVQQNIISVSPKLPPGSYTGKFAISSCIPGQPSLNSSGFKITLKHP